MDHVISRQDELFKSGGLARLVPELTATFLGIKQRIASRRAKAAAASAAVEGPSFVDWCVTDWAVQGGNPNLKLGNW